MTMSGTEIYKRTATYEREAATIRLHAPQWKLLLSFDGQRSVADIAVSAGLSFSEALALAETFLKRDWIAEQPITLEEYLKRASASGTFTGGVIPSSVVLTEPGSDGKPESKPEASTASAMTGAGSASTPATAPLPTARPPARSSRGPMRLSSVVDFIVSMAETLPLGQLLAYRVFLRVPPEILQSEDIVSIHLVDDTSIVRTEPLQRAIIAAVQEIMRRPLPDSVYAPA
jgi:hypothetical protein